MKMKINEWSVESVILKGHPIIPLNKINSRFLTNDIEKCVSFDVLKIRFNMSILVWASACVCVSYVWLFECVCMSLWFTYTLARVSIKGVETIWSCCFQWFLFPIPFVFILFVFINDLRLGYGKRNAEDIHPLILTPLHLHSAPSWHDNVCVWNIYNYLCDPLLGAYLWRYLENVLEFIKPNDPFWDRKNDLDFYVSRRLIF